FGAAVASAGGTAAAVALGTAMAPAEGACVAAGGAIPITAPVMVATVLGIAIAAALTAAFSRGAVDRPARTTRTGIPPPPTRPPQQREADDPLPRLVRPPCGRRSGFGRRKPLGGRLGRPHRARQRSGVDWRAGPALRPRARRAHPCFCAAVPRRRTEVLQEVG